MKQLLLNSANQHNLNKTTQLRITMEDKILMFPCSINYSIDEVEDYLVKLVNHDTPIQPKPSFRYQQVDDSLQVNFTNTTQHIPDNASWQWLLVGTNGAEEVIGTDVDLNYSFTQPGEYHIRLIMTVVDQEYLVQQRIQVASLSDTDEPHELETPDEPSQPTDSPQHKKGGSLTIFWLLLMTILLFNIKKPKRLTHY